MLRHLVIEERHGGIVRIANGSGTVDVTGETLEEAFLNAMRAAAITSDNYQIGNNYEAASVLDNIMGTRDFPALDSVRGVAG